MRSSRELKKESVSLNLEFRAEDSGGLPVVNDRVLRGFRPRRSDTRQTFHR